MEVESIIKWKQPAKYYACLMEQENICINTKIAVDKYKQIKKGTHNPPCTLLKNNSRKTVLDECGIHYPTVYPWLKLWFR